MNKILTFIFLSLFFCNTSFAESYYFKNCKINNAVTADYIIDLGLDGGKKGGQLIFEGTPEELIKNKKSYTSKYLKEKLQEKKD